MKLKSGIASSVGAITLLSLGFLPTPETAEAATFSGQTVDISFEAGISGNAVDFRDDATVPSFNDPGTGEIQAGTGGFFSLIGNSVEIKDLCQGAPAPGGNGFNCSGGGPGIQDGPIAATPLVGGFVEDFITEQSNSFSIDLLASSFENTFDLVSAGPVNFVSLVTTFNGNFNDNLSGDTFKVAGVILDSFDFDEDLFDAAGQPIFNIGGLDAQTFLETSASGDLTVSLRVIPEPTTIIGSALFSLVGAAGVLKKRRKNQKPA